MLILYSVSSRLNCLTACLILREVQWCSKSVMVKASKQENGNPFLSWYENWYSETSVMWPRKSNNYRMFTIHLTGFYGKKGFGSLLHNSLVVLHRSHCAMIPCYRYSCPANSIILYVSSEVLFQPLIHWGRVMNKCVSYLNIIGSDNGLSPERRQAIV